MIKTSQLEKTVNDFGMCTANDILSSLKGKFFGFHNNTDLPLGIAEIVEVTKDALYLNLRSCSCELHSGETGRHGLSFRRVSFKLDVEREIEIRGEFHKSAATLTCSIETTQGDCNDDEWNFFTTYARDDYPEEDWLELWGYLFLDEESATRYFQK